MSSAIVFSWRGQEVTSAGWGNRVTHSATALDSLCLIPGLWMEICIHAASVSKLNPTTNPQHTGE